jgi:GAF domain-containing protein
VEPVTLGILLLLVGVVLTVLTWFLLRVSSQTRPVPSEPSQRLPAGLDLDNHPDGLLVVEPGGRILHCNQQVRNWFDLGTRPPVLELLVRQARPGKKLLNLCAREGQARLNVRGRTLEASSYAFPGRNYGHLMMVVLRPQLAGGLIAPESGQAGRALGVFTELSQAMAASLDLETTLQAVLENVERLIPADFAEITLWNPGHQELVPYRFIGLAGVDRRLSHGEERYKAGEGYSGYLISEKQPLLVADVDAPNVVYPALDRQKYPFRAYLGVPLIAGQELVGTLELASFDKNRFSETDRDTLTLLGGQAAVALHNAILFEQEQQQARELVGLARLVQATSSVSEPEQLIARLVDSLSGLFDVERLGFLLFDENRRMLVCQAPFIGIPAAVVALYRVPIPEGSPANDVIQSQDMIIAAHAPTHSALELLGINQVAEAAGMRDTILVPLASSGRFLGYLQVANKTDGQPFSDEDIRLLAIVAGQIGPLLGNASLIQETRRRAQRSEALRRISNLAGSAATLDEILQFSLQELQTMLEADAAVIFLLDEQVGELRIHLPSLIGVQAEDLAEVSRLPLDSPDFAATVTSTQRNFFTRNATQDERILPYFRSLVRSQELQALIDVPLVIRDRGVGELVLVSRNPEAFQHSDLVFAATAAGQLAGAVERSILYAQTDEKLRRRVDELTALTTISRELGSAEKLEVLLPRALEEVLRLTEAEAGRIVLLNTATGGRAQADLFMGAYPELPLATLEKQVIDTRLPQLVADFAGSPEAPLVEGIQSAVLAPINYEGRTLGVLHLWSGQPGYFDTAAFDTVQACAVQVATGLSSTLRLHEQARQNVLLQRRVNTLTQLMEASRAQPISRPLEESMQAVAEAVREATPFQAVLISVYDANRKLLQRAAGAGFSPEQFQEMQRFQQPWSSVQEYLQETFRVGQAYFIPTEKKPIDPPDVHTVYVLKPRELEADRAAWNPDDLLLAPIFGTQGEPLGLISVDDPRNGLRPDQAALETLELFASQAALTIESHQKLREFEEQVSYLRQQMERAEKAAAATQENLPVLLKKDREQTVLLHHLSRQSNNIRAGLEIAELVYQQQSQPEAFEVVGRELLLRFGWDVVLIAESDDGGPRLVHTRGAVKDSEGLDALLGQRNPLRQSLQSGEILLENDVAAASQWQNTALLQAIEAGSFVCFPLAAHDRPVAVVLVAGKGAREAFSTEDRRVYRLLAGQISLALRNIHLITDTQQRLQEVNLLLAFTRQLGSLETGAILDTLIDTALKVAQNAEGGAVLLWDAQVNQLATRAARGYPQAEHLIGVGYPLQGTLPGRAFRERQTLRVDEVHFAQDYALSQEDLLRYRDATQGRLPVSALVVQIKSGDQPLGVLALDDFRSVGGFSPEDQALIESLAQQTALALENARLFQASERRARQLQALTEISGEMSASLQSEELVATLLPRLKSVSSYDTATLWLRFDEHLTVSAVDGFEDREERAGLTVATQDSQLLSEMIASGKPIVVGDMHGDERFPSMVETPHHSWLGLPLIAKGDVIGVIALEKTERDFYQPDSIQILTAFASQAAVSLQNATLFDDSVRRALEMDQQTQRLSSLNRFATTLSSSLDMTQIMKTIISEVQRQISSPAISIVLFDRLGRAQLWAEAPAAHAELPVQLPAAPLFVFLHETQSIFNTEDVTAEAELAPLQEFLAGAQTRSLLVAPMATGGEVQGGVFIHENRRVRRFSAEEIDLLRTITS